MLFQFVWLLSVAESVPTALALRFQGECPTIDGEKVIWTYSRPSSIVVRQLCFEMVFVSSPPVGNATPLESAEWQRFDHTDARLNAFIDEEKNRIYDQHGFVVTLFDAESNRSAL